MLHFLSFTSRETIPQRCQPFRPLLYLGLLLSLFSGCVEKGEPIGHGYSRSGNLIYFEGKRIDRAGGSQIHKFSKSIGRLLTLCSNLDADSFEVLSEEYSKDKNMVYYKWISPGKFWVVEMPDADPGSFELLDMNLARDRNHVWTMDTPVSGADPATAEILHPHYVWKDQHKVYYQSRGISNADPQTFQHLGATYYKDANAVYWCDSAIEDADPDTFEVLGESFFGKDKNQVYRSGEPLPYLDPPSSKLLLHDDYGYQVLSDKNGVYLNRLKFLHADPNDFEMIDNLTGRGGDYVFLVDRSHSTPVTVYKEEGKLVASTMMYEKSTATPLAIVKAEVSGETLTNFQLSPPSDDSPATTVPDWQIVNFQRPDLVKRMKAAAKHLK